MYKVLLTYLLKMEKFYINPFYLQIIQAQIHQDVGDSVSTTIYDINTNDGQCEIRNTLYDLIIFDTPEGSSEYIIEEISSFRAKNYLFIGDIVKYGQLKEFLLCLQDHTDIPVYACIDDNAIRGELINVLCRSEKVDKISGLAYINNRILYVNNIVNASTPKKNISLQFSDSIIQSYEDRGIQVFLDGVSRGCENNCSFCKLGNNPLIHHYIRSSNVDVISTIKDFQSRCRKKMFIQFTDENFFGGGVNRLRRINCFANELNKSNFNGYIGIDTRLDSVIRNSESTEQAEFRKSVWINMIQNGLKYCFLGLESFNSEQSARYNKQLDLSDFSYVINFFNENHIYFTVGLILWDPLMTIEELQENLDFIYENSIIGRTASLLKILRIQVNSQYWKRNNKELGSQKIEVEDFFHVANTPLLYKDLRIRKIIPYVQTVYSWFNDNGYRHSDVSLFEVVLDEGAPLILCNIPTMVSQMEFDVLRYLLSIDVFNPKVIYTELKNICLPCVQTIIYELAECNLKMNPDNIAWSIYYYYSTVFEKILTNAEQYLKPNIKVHEVHGSDLRNC